MPEQTKAAARGETTGSVVPRRRRTTKVSATIMQVNHVKILAEDECLMDIGINVYQLQTAQGTMI